MGGMVYCTACTYTVLFLISAVQAQVPSKDARRKGGGLQSECRWMLDETVTRKGNNA